jgi:hypothetical protein
MGGSRHVHVTLSHTFHTTFPLARLHRLQLTARYDNTWHGLKLFEDLDSAGAGRFEGAGVEAPGYNFG